MIKKVFKSMASGQITITYIIGWGVVIITAVIGGVIANSRITESKLDDVRTIATNNFTANVQRISSLEADNKQLKDDIKEIKTDIKEILKRVR